MALNTTIDAVHPGGADRGFAVVAAEVKAFANQTVEATEEIDGQIRAVRQATGRTAEAHSAAIAAIARNIHEFAQNIQKTSQCMTEVPGEARQSLSAAHEVLEIVAEISNQSSVLSAATDTILTDVRTA